MQTRTLSAIETLLSTAIGYGVALLTQVVVFPQFGIHVRARDHIGIGLIFTAVSIIRGYLVRRWFNWLEARNANRAA